MEQQDKPRINFNVVLDIYDTTAWTGKQFDATFQVDLKRLVQNPADLAKPFKITFAYYMRGDAPATSGILITNLYSLNMDLHRKNSIHNYNKPLTYAGNLFPSNIIPFNAAFIALKARPCDNHEFYVDNATNLTEIRLTTILNASGTMFNPNDTLSVNNATKYIVYLLFEEA